ncbi:MAG TPA: DUF4255 domain-containing protein [Candidatus Udaeobacter sp.]|nr:DUF4255 domain-containing protein [Candidatus Udaeobacter sp.]
MSDALAIAAVTGLLRDLLTGVMTRPDLNLSTVVGSAVDVSALPPDLIKSETKGINRLNLFLYQVQPNQGWRNVNHPSRDGRGDRIANPPLGLDLYYLLTAYAGADMHAEVLLGYAMQYLHELGVMTREMIRNQFNAWSGSADPLLKALPGSRLADQIEQIKISPYALNTEEMSKLWTATQAHYRPTAAYHVSVVLIESQYPTRAALPVLQRGLGDFGVAVQPNLVPPLPTIESLEPPQQQTAIRMGETLTINGFNLAGSPLNVEFIHARSPNALTLSVATATPTQWTVNISPLNPDDWEIGIYRVAGVIGSGTTQVTTNELPLALAPRIVSINASKAAGVVTLTVKCSPKVWQEQEVSLIVGDRAIVAEPIASAKTDTLTFKSSDLPSGPQWVRLRVEGTDSILIDRTKTPPIFDATQQVTIP